MFGRDVFEASHVPSRAFAHARDPLLRRAIPHRRKGPFTAAASAALLVAVVACQEEAPTALDDSQLPDEPLTFEVELPWSEFGSDAQVLGGYSWPSVLSAPVVTRSYLGDLEARTLLRFTGFPALVRVNNDDGTLVDDTDLTYISAFLTLGFDTLLSVAPGPVRVELGGLQEEWAARTTSWTLAVDSVGDQRAWSAPGGGAVDSIATGLWDPTVSDSVNFSMDSASIATWVDGLDSSRGARVSTTTDGALLVLTRALLQVSIRPSVGDSIVEDTVNLLERTVLYDPPPAAPTGLRVGGAPAWRTFMAVSAPELNGPPELCAAVGCPYTPAAGELSFAALRLTSAASEAAFQPYDTLRLDVRAALSPARLPKSPLGPSETFGLGTPIAPEAFGSSPGSAVEIPITNFMRTLLSGSDASGNPPSSTLAILSAAEPESVTFASFVGPGDPGQPSLRMILTVGAPQGLP